MVAGEKLARKNAYMDKLTSLIEESAMALIVGVDNVGSRSMQFIRIALRGKATLLMGKNTMIRTALRKRYEVTEDEGLTNLLSAINGNIGFIFMKDTSALEAIRETLKEYRVPAAAKAGTIAQCDAHVKAGPSGLEPSQTNFFQALNIPTKIVKGIIEIVSDVHLIKQGEKVTLSACALLNKLGIKPFEYGMEVLQVYQDGAVFDQAVLDISDAVLVGMFMRGAANVAAFGREIGVPTEAGLPHMVAGAFKNIVSIVLACDVSGGEKADEAKAILSDPEKMAAMKAAAAAGASAGGAAAGGAAEKAAPAAAEEEEEDDMDFDLFD